VSRRRLPQVERAAVVRLWLARQGLSRPRSAPLTRRRLVAHLEAAGALQLDSINVVDRAHYLTLWSRFGPYDRAALDGWIYGERLAYEYWGHEASILPLSHLPVGRRRMRRFPPPSYTDKAWWGHWATSPASKRRVLRRLREEGPLESADFERRPGEAPGDAMFPLMKEDKRSLKLLWHAGRVAVTERRHFRCVYDLAERVLPEGPAATTREYHDSWLFAGLAGNGVAGERHLANYFTAPALSAEERRAVIRRNLRAGRIVAVRIAGLAGEHYARPRDLDELATAPEPRGTTLLAPFDSLLWQRARAADLLDFDYRVEIYVPPGKRRYGYYCLPILHDGRLVGRLEPKLHRARGVLEVKSLHLEPGFEAGASFAPALGEAIASLAEFVGAAKLDLPTDWRHLARAARPSR
jgi:uncharacterized protein